jgi:hypothetical protein
MSSYCATVMLNDNGWEAFLFVWANFALCSFDFFFDSSLANDLIEWGEAITKRKVEKK